MTSSALQRWSMRMGPTRPALPANLLARLGAPEHTFAPNRRFRTASTIVGLILVVLGIIFCLSWAANIPAGGAAGGKLNILLGGGLLLCGFVAIFGPRQVPPTWVFVCPQGLVRVRGADWEAVDWAKVLRFEEISASSRVKVRQCRVVLADGTEWGFLADYIADFQKLTEALGRKMVERGANSDESDRSRV